MGPSVRQFVVTVQGTELGEGEALTEFDDREFFVSGTTGKLTDLLKKFVGD